MLKRKQKILEKLHRVFFGFDAQIQIYGWSWKYWYHVDASKSNEGDYVAVTDGIFCFQRRYAA